MLKYILISFMFFIIGCGVDQFDKDPFEVTSIEAMGNNNNNDKFNNKCKYQLKTNLLLNGNLFYIGKCGMWNVGDKIALIKIDINANPGACTNIRF
jgi:hypothetical protein